MTSSRLPGKVLLSLAGKPALERLIERLRRSKYIDEIVVAATNNAADQPLADLAAKLGVKSWRGSENDVLKRVLDAIHSVNGEIEVEVTGDIPLLDHALIDQGIAELFNRKVDYVTNFIPPSFPVGIDVQAFPTTVLEKVDIRTKDPIDRTHVSYYIYTHPEEWRIYYWHATGEYYWPELRLTLDERADYEFLNTIFEQLLPQKEDFTALDIIRWLRTHPEILEMNKHVRQKDPTEG